MSKKVAVAAGVIAMAGCYALNHVSHAAGFALVSKAKTTPPKKVTKWSAVSTAITTIVNTACGETACVAKNGVSPVIDAATAKICVDHISSGFKKALDDDVADKAVEGTPTQLLAFKTSTYANIRTKVGGLAKVEANEWAKDDTVFKVLDAHFKSLVGRMDGKIGSGMDTTKTCGQDDFDKKCPEKAEKKDLEANGCKAMLTTVVESVKAVKVVEEFGAEVDDSTEVTTCVDKVSAAAKTLELDAKDAILAWVKAMQTSSSPQWLLIGGIVVLVLAIAAVGGYFFMQHRKKQAAKAAEGGI